MTEDPAKQAWQASVAIAGAPPLEEVRKRADKFFRAVRLRNRIEYVACAVVIVVFAYYLFTMEHILHKLGSVATIVAAIYAPWQLHRRASAVPPELAGTMPIYGFLRSQFARQRDALKSVVVWYVLPFLPGLALFIAGNGLDPQIQAAGPPIWARWLFLLAIPVFVGIVWWINQVGARRLQRKIDEIDALTGEGG
jgi:hypothetical protein